MIRISNIPIVARLLSFAKEPTGTWIVGALAFLSTAVGAGVLAVSTRESANLGYPYESVINVASLILLFLGFVLGSVSLVVQRDRMDTAKPPNADVIRRWLVAGILLTAVGGSALGQMGTLLAGFHIGGEPSIGQSAVQGFGDPRSRQAKIDEGLVTWSRYARPSTHEELTGEELPIASQTFEEDQNAPITVLAWFFGLDSGLFVPAYFSAIGALLVLAIRTLHSRAEFIGMTMKQSGDVIPAYLRVARLSVIFLIVAAAADQFENWRALTSTTSAWFELKAQGVMSVDGTAALLLGAATVVKWLLLGLVLLNLLLLGSFLLRHGADSDEAWDGVRSGWQSFLAIRVQVIAVALFAVMMSLPFQVDDTFRRWADGWEVPIVATVAVFAFALAVYQSGRWLVRLHIETTRSEDRTSVFALSILTVVAVIILAYAAGGVNWEALMVPVVIALALVVLSVMCRSFPVRGAILPGVRVGVAPPILAMIVVASFGLAIARASFGTYVYASMQGRRPWALAVLVAWGLVVVFGSWFILRLPAVTTAQEGERQHHGWIPSAALLACVVGWMVLVLVLDRTVFAIAPRLGTAAVLALFFALFAYTLSSAVAVGMSAWSKPPGVFRAVGLRRVPVLTFVAVWIVVVSLLPLDLSLHDAVSEAAGPRAFQADTLGGAFTRWTEHNCLTAGPPSEGPRTIPAVPLVLVSSSGGGVRAAVWTSFVMDRTFGFREQQELPEGCPLFGIEAENGRASSLFALSGISGGGLGFVEYVGQLLEGEVTPGSAEGRIYQHLSDDSLAPTLAWMLFVESAWSLIRFDADRDRGDILEESWRRQWPERTLDRDFLDVRVPDAPLLLLNGASAETGCRFNGSVLDANGRARDETVVTGCLEMPSLEGASGAVLPSTIDLVDFLCDDDREISLAAAALFTARFPGISPVGEVEQCSVKTDDVAPVDEARDPSPETFVVDGGYLEGSGTATVLDLWHALEPLIAEHNRSPEATACIVPFFAQIDNSYLEPRPPGDVEAPPELLGLQEASANSRNRNGFTIASRQAAQVAFRQPFSLGGVTITLGGRVVDDRFALFSLRSHPGAEAPLGWTLSDGSFTSLFSQYELNSRSESRVNDWFRRMWCEVPG